MNHLITYYAVRSAAERTAPRIALALLSATAAIALLVPEARSQTVTQPLTVTAPAESEGSPTAPALEELRNAINQTAGSIGFIDAESYKSHYASNLRDILQDSPGVYVQNRYGQEMRLSVRGSGIGRAFHLRGVELLQDGIPVNMADGSGDFYQIDPQALRAVEVYKGGNGLSYGSTALGGAINFVTPTARTAASPFSAGLSGGSFGTVQGTGQASQVIGNVDFLANATLRHSDGYRDHSQGDYSQLNANLGYRLRPDLETRFYVGSYDIDQNLPGALTRAQALNSPRMATSAALTGDQSRQVHVQRVANKTAWVLDSGTLDLTGWYIHKELYHPIFQVIDQDGDTYGIAPRYAGSFDLGGHRNDVILGGRAYAGSNNARQFTNVSGSRGAQTLESDQYARTTEAYLENHYYVVPDVAIMAGIKAFESAREFDNYTAGRSTEKSYSGINPKLGLLWEPRKDIQVFTDVTRSQDVPDFSELVQSSFNNTSFVPLAAQKAWTYEIGTRGKHDRFGWDVTAYRSEIRGEMLQFTTNSSIPASTFNAGDTVHQGIELGGSVRVFDDAVRKGDSITLLQLWNYSDFRFDGDRQYGDNRIAGTPQHVLRTRLRYLTADGFYVEPAIDWVPEGAYVDYANTLKTPSYAMLGLTTGIDMDNGLSLFLEGRNLADKRYISDFGTVTDARTASTAVFYPGDGRSIYGGLRYRF